MRPRQRSWPRLWLMTDERIGQKLWPAIDRLPRGAGIVLRHYSHAGPEREALARQLASTAQLRGLVLAIAADVALAKRVGAALVHNPATPTDLPFSRSVHNLSEADAAHLEEAAMAFVSPVFATRSHPGSEPLGPALAGQIARAAGVPAIALGGVNARNFAQLKGEGFYGWAGIDAWLSD